MPLIYPVFRKCNKAEPRMLKLKKILPSFLQEKKRLRKLGKSLEHHSYERTCPICGYCGKFDIWFGVTLIRDNTCPQCDSHPRQRLFWLWYQDNAHDIVEPILHFAPEKSIASRFKKIYTNYQTADLYANADLKINIEDINLPSDSVATVLCNHVLEHVDDRKALKELYRIIKPSGRLVCSVPIIEGWEKTYENPQIQSEYDRELHFDQRDHIRFYGSDFRIRLREACFHSVMEKTAYGNDVVQYGLIRGEKFFICQKTKI
jgi:hypothetical protein